MTSAINTSSSPNSQNVNQPCSNGEQAIVDSEKPIGVITQIVAKNLEKGFSVMDLPPKFFATLINNFSVKELLHVRLIDNTWHAIVEHVWRLKCQQSFQIEKYPEGVKLKPLFIFLSLQRIEKEIKKQGAPKEFVFIDLPYPIYEINSIALMVHDNALVDPNSDLGKFCLHQLCIRFESDLTLMLWLSHAGFNVLHFHIKENNIPFVRAILSEATVDMEVTDLEGRTVLQTTLLDPQCHGTNFENAILIIQKKADVNARIKSEDDFPGYTPLLCAIYKEEDENEKKKLLQVIRQLIEAGADIDAADDEKLTPLHLACEKQMWEIVQLLIDYHANVDPIQKLKKHRQDPHFCANTPLHRAILYMNKNNPLCIQTIKNLIEAGADITGEKNEGYSALHLACYMGCLELIDFIIQKKTNLNTRIPVKENAKEQFEQELLEVGSWLSEGPYVSAYHIEIKESQKQSLIAKRKKEEELEGATALHVTVLYCDINDPEDKKTRMLIVQKLLDAGANRSVLNNQYLSPLDLAREKGFTEVIDLLRLKEEYIYF